MTWPIPHLTAEDLDAFHSASLSPKATRHINECDQCRVLVEGDRALLQGLAALPTFAPRAGFADRVLAQVPLPARAPARVGSIRRLALAASVTVAAGASVVWSILNRALLGSWVDRGTTGLGNLFWESVASIGQNLAEQPWLAGLQQFGSSGGRAALAGGVLLAGYAGALVALRRLLRHPAPVSNPGW